MNRLLLPLIIFGSVGASALICMDNPNENKELSRVHTQLSLQGDFIVGVSQLNKVNENITELRLELLRQENDEREAAMQARLQAEHGSLLELEQRHNTHADEARNSLDAIAMAMRGMEKLQAKEDAKTAASIASLRRDHKDLEYLTLGLALVAGCAVGHLIDRTIDLKNQIGSQARATKDNSKAIAQLDGQINGLQDQQRPQTTQPARKDNSNADSSNASILKRLENVEAVTDRFKDYTVLPQKSDQTGLHFNATKRFGGDYGVKDHKIINVEAAKQIKALDAFYFKK